jgi:ATP-dependent Clp protease adaptor protein ClpS
LIWRKDESDYTLHLRRKDRSGGRAALRPATFTPRVHREDMSRTANGLLALSERLSANGAGSSNPRGGDDRTGTALITKTKARTKRPNLYRVLLLNDDYTPMEFVVHVLERFFNKNREDATRVMLHVHQNGVGECGIFTYEVAETKVTQVMDFARKHQHPLQCVMEKK